MGGWIASAYGDRLPANRPTGPHGAAARLARPRRPAFVASDDKQDSAIGLREAETASEAGLQVLNGSGFQRNVRGQSLSFRCRWLESELVDAHRVIGHNEAVEVLQRIEQ